MNYLFQRAGLALVLAVTVVALVTFPSSDSFSRAGSKLPPDFPNPAVVSALSDQASLHNPGFDNHDWYYFHERYDSTYPDGPGGSGKPILPDDDNNNPDQIPADQLQDWRLWYMRNTPLVQTFDESNIVHSAQSVAIRTHDGDVHQGGLYQVIYDTTPCRLYTFQIYGRSQPDPGENPYSSLRAGIDKAGWHPDSATDPAVPEAFPSTTVWGEAHDYKRTFGSLSVTAEAEADHIVVYTYADARGGRRHAIIWDTGSFQDVTPPDLLSDPDNPSGDASGISSGPNVTPDSSTSATVSWNTSGEALGQVYYRLISTPFTPVSPTETLSYTVYLPLISRAPGPWLSTSLQGEASISAHSKLISDLQPGGTYEYIVASRGLSGGQCVTWVSEKKEFTTSQ